MWHVLGDYQPPCLLVWKLTHSFIHGSVYVTVNKRKDERKKTSWFFNRTIQNMRSFSVQSSQNATCQLCFRFFFTFFYLLFFWFRLSVIYLETSFDSGSHFGWLNDEVKWPLPASPSAPCCFSTPLCCLPACVPAARLNWPVECADSQRSDVSRPVDLVSGRCLRRGMCWRGPRFLAVGGGGGGGEASPPEWFLHEGRQQ